ncbi:MAG: site-specific DNA-methyltransferase, partial [Acetobacter sp.]|nr:site-specific DNA-methyltransferase [Acetobacter sp.]
MLYPRLVLARQRLSADGVFFCRIEDRNPAHVKLLFDEIFGEDNFLCNFIWEKTQHFGRQKINFYSNNEYILCYAKSLYCAENKKRLLTDSIKTDFEDAPLYNVSNNKHVMTFPKNSVLFKIGDGVYTKSSEPEKYELLDYVNVENQTNINDFRICFQSRWSNESLQQAIKKGAKVLIKSEKFSPRIIYPDDKKSISSPKTIIFTNSKNPNCTAYNSVKVGTTENGSAEIETLLSKNVIDYPKPVSLLFYLIGISSQKDSLILDFFAGSGTTGHAVLELNREDGGHRKFILCQNNEKTNTTPNGIAYDVTAKRLKRVMTGECYDGTKPEAWLKKHEPYGGALEVYEIGEVSSFETAEGKTPFEVIDETLYGKEKFKTIKEKIEWVCTNFEKTQKYLEESEHNQECED